MEAGDFYSSSGVSLKRIKTTDKKLSIEVDSKPNVDYEIIFMGYKKGAEAVVALKKVQDTTASYAFQKEDVFVRVSINSDAKKENPIMVDEIKKAWTQPIFAP